MGEEDIASEDRTPFERQRRTVRRRAALTRNDVLATALTLVDADGVEAFSMRRLGKALGRDPMRLYRHASSKDALLDGVVELVMSKLAVPALHEVVDWEAGLRYTAHSFRSIAVEHPHVVPLLVTRPLATPLAMRPLGTLRPLENLLELLVGAGFDGRGALHAYRLYFGFLFGHILNELQEQVHNPEETTDLLRLGLHRLPALEFPRLRGLAGELATYDGLQELEEGLDIVLEGLRRKLADQKPNHEVRRG
ncbi:TetR/AcrR family transcriptional regulator C-terminal domain-containing protein [Pseudonocardia sp. TRM90224]|uniref:TetR/AcrR family transcriptional regulator C-terminal domain-containing protein n=1 Tax=Pseudonocardia sp. TRM90224 TaxID=2812678 RepID=UPI001E58FA5D|nr:TetR/AcrR family transcriptional regulator C-terminal domain-containing protein [Pseudonocardia sp. TRM90224]